MTEPRADTSLGGERRGFPSTAWSQIVRDTHGEDSRVRTMETLAGLYWKPVYVYIRARWTKTNEDSKDLTQEFFVWMLESDFLGKADPQRGRFRAFMKSALDRFLVDRERERGSRKRGGGRVILSLDGGDGERPPWTLPDAGAGSPADLLDAVWRSEILARGATSLQELYRREGKAVYYDVFHEYLLAMEAEVDYRKVAEKFGLTTDDVSNHLRQAKKRFQEIVKDIVVQTVDGPDDLQEELRFLFGPRP